jgi:hypothetical protein
MSYQDPRNGNDGVQHESDNHPDGLLTHGPRRTPQ